LSKNISVGVIGLGYVGLPMLHLLSQKKIDCYGFDIDKSKIRDIKKNTSYISDLKNTNLKIINKNKIFSMNEIQNINKVDYIIFCLPTPLNKHKAPDMSLIKNAFNRVKKYLKKKQTIILESTVYPGATKDIFYSYLNKKFNIGKNFFLCYSSERISPGQINKKEYKFFFHNTTKVISGFNHQSEKKINYLYKKIFKKLYLAKSLKIAEMSKLLENSYRSVNIGLVNELKIICSKLKLNIHEVLETSKTKPFGFSAFYPGPGVGGHCIPIDPVFIKWIAKKNGAKANFIDLARKTNINISEWIINEICKREKKIRNKKLLKKIFIIGMAYKKDVNDTRESPSIKIYKKLINFNNIIDFHDDKVKQLTINKKILFSKPLNHCSKYDYVILCTAHSNLNKKKLLKYSKKIFDTRGTFANKDYKKVVQL
jgi:UDP-N-acetyl-D-glucosamine dehydrogenase